jgi:hypothetical protein
MSRTFTKTFIGHLNVVQHTYMKGLGLSTPVILRFVGPLNCGGFPRAQGGLQGMQLQRYGQGMGSHQLHGTILSVISPGIWARPPARNTKVDKCDRSM